MELRHLRYFVAVAETGSLTVAAERRLHTAQPSLSRQMRDLEAEVGTALLTRSVSGVALTAAGTAFLEHARQALAQAAMAVQAARRAADPAKPRFALGFLTGQEADWLPVAMDLLHDELPTVDVTICSETSPRLAAALATGALDLAFMRRETGPPGLLFRTVSTEELIVVLSDAHRLAALDAVPVAELAEELFIGMSDTAPVLRALIDRTLSQAGIAPRRGHAIDHLGMAMSLVASTGGVTLMPGYARRFLPHGITSRRLAGEPPTIDLVVGYGAANGAPLLHRMLARLERVIAGRAA